MLSEAVVTFPKSDVDGNSPDLGPLEMDTGDERLEGGAVSDGRYTPLIPYPLPPVPLR